MPYTRRGAAYTPGQKVPIIGPWISRLGRVYRIWSEPCNPTPWIMVEAAFYSAPRLLWSLYGPDLIDYKYDQITKNFKTHGRRGKMKIWDVSYPAYEPPRGFGQVLFRGAEIAQKVGWYFIVIDATTEFIVNWSTLVYQLEGCRAPGILYADMRGPAPFTKLGAGVPYKYNELELVDRQGLATGPTGIGLTTEKEYVASFTFAASPVDIGLGPGTTATAELWDNTNGIGLGSPTTGIDPISGHMVSQGAFFAPRTIFATTEIGLRVSPGVGTYQVDACSLHVSASNIKLDLELNSGLKKIIWPTLS